MSTHTTMRGSSRPASILPVSGKPTSSKYVWTKVLHVESVILKNTEHDHLFLPWFAWVVNFFIYLSLPFLSPFLFIWMNWQDNTVLIENCNAYCWVCETLLTRREIIVRAGRFLLFNTPPNWKARPLSIENWCTLHVWFASPKQGSLLLFNPRRRCGLFTRIAFFATEKHTCGNTTGFLANWFKNTKLKLP